MAPAFTLLMRRHKDALHRSVWRCVGDRDTVLDVIQGSAVSVWKALQRHDKDRRPLFCIALCLLFAQT